MSIIAEVIESKKSPSKIILHGRAGCGKTTLLKLIGQKLMEQELSFLYVSESEDSDLMGQIRLLLLIMTNAHVTLLIDGAHRFESHFIEELLKYSGNVVLASQQFSYSSSGWTLFNLEKQS